MRYLPEKFPIRYALIVSGWLEDDNPDKEELQFYTPARSEMLFRQLLLLLQKEPLNEGLLIPESQTIKFKYMDVEVMNIARINAPHDWMNKLETEITKIIPEIKRSSRSWGTAFDLGLYSYAGASESPSFLVAHTMASKHNDQFGSIHEIVHNFGHIENHSNIKFLHSIFEKIRKNEITNFQLYESLARYPKPIYITMPYSKIWEKLDTGFQDGIVSVGSRFNKEDIIRECEVDDEETDKKKYSKNKISVAVCKSWEELFAEEIYSIYKMFSFCKNCSKALPFDYQGKYCPETKDNEECTRKRARDRARKITSSKKNL